MKIDIEKEVKELTVELRPADGYLECENTIITHIKKHIRNGISILDTESYLKELVICFEDRMLSSSCRSRRATRMDQSQRQLTAHCGDGLRLGAQGRGHVRRFEAGLCR
jgi:hypothetical protein